MSHQHSNKMSDAFLDVGAYFSEEEWKLLHEWQKELYRNVMKEIHQALISLGPLIATTLFSLRDKEKEEPCPLDNQDSERRNSLNCSPRDAIANTDALCRINREGNVYLKSRKESAVKERNDRLNTGFPFLNSDTCGRKEEPASIFIDDLGMEVKESSTDPNSGYEVVSFCIKDEDEAYYMSHQDSRKIESIGSPTGERTINRKHKLGNNVKSTEKSTSCKVSPKDVKVSLLHSSEKGKQHSSPLWADINQEIGEAKTTRGESGFSHPAHLISQQGTPKAERSEQCNNWETNLSLAGASQQNLQHDWKRLSSTEGERTMNRKHKLGINVKSTEKSTSCKVSPKDVKVSLLHSSEKGKQHSSPLWADIIQEIGEGNTTQGESSFSHPAHLISQQGTPKAERAEQCNNWGTNLSLAGVSQQNLQHNWKMFSSTEGERTMNRKHKLENNVKSTEKSTSCKVSSKYVKVSLLHSSEKGKQHSSQLWAEINQEIGEGKTAQCESSFSHPANLISQQGTPKAERSEQCNNWETNLSLSHLSQQNLQHNWKMFSSTEGEESFSFSEEYLVQHKSVNLGEKPYQCTDCEKTFRKKVYLVSHMRTHTGEKPYHCTKCEKSFRQKSHLNRHQKSHATNNAEHYSDRS